VLVFLVDSFERLLCLGRCGNPNPQDVDIN
jgi:hypothetical protein